jgi:SpoVK/Ycf46/Vps4 family AAA+-type ATPase
MGAIRTEFIALIRGRYPLIYIVSSEERRVEADLRGVAKELGKQLWLWTFTRGFVDASTGTQQDNTIEPIDALNKILETPKTGAFLYVLKDFHPFLESSQAQVANIRKLRDAVYALQETNSSLFILSPVLRLPPELEKDTTVIEYPLPTKDELDQLLTTFEKEHGHKATIQLDGEVRKAMVGSLLGLTEIEAENVLSRALVNDRRLDASDLDLIIKEKEQIIKKSGILEFYPLREGMKDVGGLDRLKKWLQQERAVFFNEAAAQRGIRTPRGMMLIGVPGCGKSLAAKAVANEWKMPLLRFDVGRVFGMYVGQSEENIRRAIRTAESIAPCILWIDEIEKGFSGLNGDHDSGATKRVFGTFVTWLQEKESPVYVVATGNDISNLPPELLRKGRFDEIFFVDLPSEPERQEIFVVHLGNRKQKLDRFDLKHLAQMTPGYTGADIEGIVDQGLRAAFNENGREATTEDFLRIVEQTLPLSATMKEKIEALRAWARTRARPASTVAEQVPIPVEAEFAIHRRLEF